MLFLSSQPCFRILLTALFVLWIQVQASAQGASRWQQRAEYVMTIDMNTNEHRFEGKQKLTYYNNSPDTLTRVFYHLYFNAFQPGSMMDIRSRTIEDPDFRVKDRIFQLKEDEIGYQKINSLKQDGKNLNYKVRETILEVILSQPLLPGKKTLLEMDFSAQVPVQIRRSGRNNREGIDYSMAQWYPKLCEYDHEGWHNNPYVAREFYGVWGDFDVKISIDSTFVVAATGYLQNPEQIGHGYQAKGQVVKRPGNKKLNWHFVAKDVHDFVWAADPDYRHDIAQVPDGPAIHFFYKGDQSQYVQNWKEMQSFAVKTMQIMNQRFGKYPYKSYSVIQGGDGGMEYPMATLINGYGSLQGLINVTVHEMIHSWYQMLLATNESLYAWMDEGFTTYAENMVMDELAGENAPNPHLGNYGNYFNIVKRGIEEPLSLHADHFQYNSAYSMAAYSKGCIVVSQLGYIIGEKALSKGMLDYFNQWKFKHPTFTDFKKVMEKASGLELDWYFIYWVNTTHTIDYAIQSVESIDNKTTLTLKKIGRMPMPLDVQVNYKNGKSEIFYIPLNLMYGEKPQEDPKINRTVKEAWPWAYPEYILQIPTGRAEIESIEIDPSLRMADVERSNNVFPTTTDKKFISK